MLAVEGKNKRGASVAFATQLISDTIANELPNSSSYVTVYDVKIQNSNFSTSTPAHNTIHLVLVTNTYGQGISVGIQCKEHNGYSISSWAYTDDVSGATFDVFSDGRVECAKALFSQSKVGETSSNIYMYATNKAQLKFLAKNKELYQKDSNQEFRSLL